MKKLMLALGTVLFSIQLFAQMNISTNLREDYTWDEETEEWELISSDEEELTFFKFNKELTMFKHTTPSITSAYIINSYEYDEENDQYTFEVMSDVGNEYTMILDEKNENIRFIGESEDGTFCVRHTIKKLWVEEEEE